MSTTLIKHPFTEADWPDLQNFDCGDAPYEFEVADWLKGKGEPEIDSALTSIDDLLAEAQEAQETHPVVGLFVHKDNVKAIRLYKWAGFSDEFDHKINSETGEVEYYKMAVVLNDELLLQIASKAKK